jgi:hypothetical protein
MCIESHLLCFWMTLNFLKAFTVTFTCIMHDRTDSERSVSSGGLTPWITFEWKTLQSEGSRGSRVAVLFDVAGGGGIKVCKFWTPPPSGSVREWRGSARERDLRMQNSYWRARPFSPVLRSVSTHLHASCGEDCVYKHWSHNDDDIFVCLMFWLIVGRA